MPSAATHYLFAKKTITELKTPLAFIKTEELQQVCYVGAQGPDPLFFYGQVPFSKRSRKKEVRSVGSYLHDHKMAQKFNEMIDYANNQEGNQRDVLFAYIFGAMLHYCLDRVAHPFIFYRSGFDENGTLTKHSYYHALYESYIDYLLESNLGIKLNTKDCIIANKAMISLVSTMYANNENLQNEDFYNSWKDMKTCEAFLKDKHGFKRWLFRKMGKQISQPYSMIKPNKNDLHLDFLNLERNIYKNPQTLEKHQHSFIELFNNAIQDTKNIVKIMKKAYNKEDVSEEVISYCDDISYNGTKENAIMVEYQSIFNE